VEVNAQNRVYGRRSLPYEPKVPAGFVSVDDDLMCSVEAKVTPTQFERHQLDLSNHLSLN
jgi:hypothetical protein